MRLTCSPAAIWKNSLFMRAMHNRRLRAESVWHICMQLTCSLCVYMTERFCSGWCVCARQTRARICTGLHYVRAYCFELFIMGLCKINESVSFGSAAPHSSALSKCTLSPPHTHPARCILDSNTKNPKSFQKMSFGLGKHFEK